MEYELASSSLEDGEIPDEGFPYYKSYLQYYYSPHSTIFIGRNSVPHFTDYKGDLYCTRLKKDIKHDYPYIPFNLLENSKTFFDNRFLYLRDLKHDQANSGRSVIPHIHVEDENDMLGADKYVLIDIKKEYGEIQSFEKKSVCESKYDKFYQQLFFAREDRSPFVKTLQATERETILVIEDRALEALAKEHSYIFCRVIEETISRAGVPPETGHRRVRKIIFEDIFYSKVAFYEYLDLYAENIVKSYNSEEIRVYDNNSMLLVVYSSTTFLKDGIIRRLYNGLDTKKNAMLICNKEGPSILGIDAASPDYARILGSFNFDLSEGDYVINNGKIYRIDNSGISIEYQDIDFSDFIKSTW